MTRSRGLITWRLGFSLLGLLLTGPGCREPDPPDGDADADVDEETPPPELELRVMTWNLEAFPLSDETVALVVEQVEAIGADVIAVQEIAEVPLFLELVSILPDHDGILASDSRDAYHRVGLIWDTTRVDLVSQETLFRDDSHNFPRPPLLAQLAVHDERGALRFDLDVVVLHLKAQDDELSLERRRAACERLESWVAARVDEGGDPDLLLLGDWNDEVTDPAEEQAFTAFLDRPDRYTFLTFELAETDAYTYIPFGSFIDHLLVTNDALGEYGQGTTEVLALDRTVPGYRERLSDHRPVMATFRIID